MLLDKPLPSNPKLECDILQIIITLQNLPLINVHVANLKEVYFSQDRCKRIFNAIVDCVNQGIEPDYVYLSTKIKDGSLDDIMMESDALTHQLEPLVNELKNLYLRRVTMINAMQVIETAYNEDKEINDIIQDIQYASSVVDAEMRNHKEKTTKFKIHQMISEVQEATKGKEHKRLFYHIDFIDDALIHYRGQIHAIGALPGGGKTSFALQSAIEQTKKGMKVVYFVLESESVELIKRMAAYESRIPVSILLNGIKSQRLMEKFGQSIETLRQIKDNLFIFGPDEWDGSIEYIETTLRKIKHDHGLDMVYLDYLQDMTKPKSVKLNSTEEIIGYNAKQFQKIMMKVEAGGVLLNQFNRASIATGKRPSMSAFRGSGAIEHCCHLMSILYPEGDERENAEKELVDIEWYSCKTRLVSNWYRKIKFFRALGRFEGECKNRFNDEDDNM